MSDYISLNLNTGLNSFYGIMKFKVNSENIELNGAILKPNVFYDLIAPIYSLPLTLFSQNPFTIDLIPIPQDSLHNEEIHLYFLNFIPDGFQQVSSGIYFSFIFNGVVYPRPCLKFIDTIILSHPTTLFISGEKGIGKSTFSRFLINKILTHYSDVYYLDIDPGQPEFFLPGTISLVHYTEYLFQPPEFNTNLSHQSLFYGGISPSDNISFFFECLNQLNSTIPKGSYLIINSFGWIEDLGFIIHQDLLKILTPEHVFVLHKADSNPILIRDRSFKVQINPRPGLISYKPFSLRDLRLITYITRSNLPISSQQPQIIDLTKCRIGFYCIECPPTECLTVLNGSIVCLCNDDRKFPETNKPINILKTMVPLTSLGYGLVRAICRKSFKLYIYTPLNLSEIHVNTILMGSVLTPEVFYKDSPRLDGNYLGLGFLNGAGTSSNPLILKNPPKFS